MHIEIMKELWANQAVRTKWDIRDTYGRPRVVLEHLINAKSKRPFCRQFTIFNRYKYYTQPGTITVTNYTKAEASHWEIKTTIDKTIQLQLDKSHGFGIEYHRRCFYDKLFVYDSTKRQKYARICGPKPNQE